MLKVSVIICTKDRPRELANALLTIMNQTRLPYEIIIIDASSSPVDISKLGIDSVIKTKIVHTPPSLVRQRNIGIGHIDKNTDLILFIDDDVELATTYIDELLQVFVADSEVIGATGYIQNLPIKDKSRLGRPNGYVDKVARNFFACNLDGNKELMWLSGCNMAYRVGVFQEDFFDEFFESYGLGEDLEFSYRVGRKGKLYFATQAQLVHHESPVARISLRRLGKMYVTNKMYIVNKYPEYFSKVMFVIFIAARMIVFFISGFIGGNADKKELFHGYIDACKAMWNK